MTLIAQHINPIHWSICLQSTLCLGRSPYTLPMLNYHIYQLPDTLKPYWTLRNFNHCVKLQIHGPILLKSATSLHSCHHEPQLYLLCITLWLSFYFLYPWIPLTLLYVVLHFNVTNLLPIYIWSYKFTQFISWPSHWFSLWKYASGHSSPRHSSIWRFTDANPSQWMDRIYLSLSCYPMCHCLCYILTLIFLKIVHY